MKLTALAASLLMSATAILSSSVIATPARAEAHDPTCDPRGSVRFICGRSIPEDIVHLPGTDWAITSAFSGAMGLRLNSIKQEKEVAILYPSPTVQKKQDMKTYGACPGPLDAEGESYFLSHGLAMNKIGDNTYALYVVHHGVRESIEVFNLQPVAGKRPKVTWVGCAVAPTGIMFNAVSPLPGGGFIATNTRAIKPGWRPGVITSFHEVFGDGLLDAFAPGEREKVAAGKDNGDLQEWHPSTGWTKVPGSEGLTPNGIEISKDGKTVYVVIGGGKLMRLSRGGGTPERAMADMGLIGDNIKWSSDGKSLLYAARKPDRSGAKVLFVDPQTLKVIDSVDSPGPLTTGYQIGRDIWITTAPGARIAIVPMPKGR